MNLLTKNRIIEEGDEWKDNKGNWNPVHVKQIGLQIMFSEYTEVRRPSEEPDKFCAPKPIQPTEGNITLEPPPKPLAETMKAKKVAKVADIPKADADYLPTVVSKKAHSHRHIVRVVKAKTEEVTRPEKSLKVRFPGSYPCPQWIGRNGTFNQVAINLSKNGDGIIKIVPEGVRGVAKNAQIEFPVSIIPEITKWLEKVATAPA